MKADSFQCSILTGVPRSGTTLSCAILNSAPNTVALVEPFDTRRFTEANSATGRVNALRDAIREARREIVKSGTAPSQVPRNGHLQEITNTFEPLHDGKLRQLATKRGRVQFDKPMSSNFQLIVKHPNMFTAMLKDLVGEFPCFAIIRNPYDVLCSWMSLQIPLRLGHAPAAERIDKGLQSTLAATHSILDRQLVLLNWYFATYRSLLKAEQVIKYEHIIETNGAALEVITGPSKIRKDDRNLVKTESPAPTLDVDLFLEKALHLAPDIFAYYSASEIAGPAS